MEINQSKFKLLQYFSSASAIAFVVTSAFLGTFYRQQSIRDLFALGEKTNVALAQSIGNIIWIRYAPYLTDTASLNAQQLRDRPQTTLLNEAIARKVRSLTVVKVKIYDLTGRTVFSTDKSQIGQDKSKSENFIAAKSGQVVTKLDHRDTFKAFSGSNLSDRQILSSYVPIYSQDDDREIVGVFELYSDVTPLVEQIGQNQRNIILGTTSVFGLLYLVLFLIVRRADRIINTQTLALQESQVRYKQQAQFEAKIAQQAEATAIIIDRVRRSQDIKGVFKDTTKELRRALESDRVIIYQINPDWGGFVVAESVASGWNSLLGEDDKFSQGQFTQPGCLLRDWLEESKKASEIDDFPQATAKKLLRKDRYSAVDDIYTKNFPDNYIKYLEKYQAKAYLIVPIFQQEQLYGLLGVYQNSSTRVWQPSEIELASLTANQLAVTLQQAEYVSQLKLQKRDLEITIQELKLAQDQLIQQEKLAALGQLIAGIAHEINTPLGAIQASASDNTKALIAAVSELPKLSEYLDELEYETFLKLLDTAIASQPFYSFSEKRSLKRQITKQLQEHQVENGRRIADLLIDIGVHDEIELYQSLLKHPQVDWILELAYDIACLMGNNQTIITSVEKAAKIIFALKNYARFDHSGDKQLADINAGLETVLEIYYNQFKRNIEVWRNYQELPQIWCYPDELIQVWTNLIHNGFQAMKDGGKLTIATAPEGNGIKVEISDTGKGIPEDVRHRIFEPFFTTKPIGEGSGLGLHISQKIIDKHQGKIAVTSKPGHTSFNIWLPLNSEPPFGDKDN